MSEQPVHLVNDTEVIRYAQRYAEANMTATVAVSRMAEPSLDSITGNLAAIEAFLLYQGKARVYGVSGPMTMSLGEEPQYFSSTYVSIPLAAPMPQVDDVVEVLTHHDWTVVGRLFRVMDVEAGGQYPAVRRMQVTGVQNSKQWTSVAQQRHPVAAIPKEWQI
jgi:hypothetical protein